MKWYPFDREKGSRQKRPPEFKLVLVYLKADREGPSDNICVGYMKNAAGDKQSPYFATPGAQQGQGWTVTHWCDCLPEGAIWPVSLTTNPEAGRRPYIS